MSTDGRLVADAPRSAASPRPTTRVARQFRSMPKSPRPNGKHFVTLHCRAASSASRRTPAGVHPSEHELLPFAQYGSGIKLCGAPRRQPRRQHTRSTSPRAAPRMSLDRGPPPEAITAPQTAPLRGCLLDRARVQRRLRRQRGETRGRRSCARCAPRGRRRPISLCAYVRLARRCRRAQPPPAGGRVRRETRTHGDEASCIAVAHSPIANATLSLFSLEDAPHRSDEVLPVAGLLAERRPTRSTDTRARDGC